jgi:flagellin-like hook-associated protein FlgL
VQGDVYVYATDPGTTQAGLFYTPSYQVFDASQNSWVTLATGATQSIPTGPVSGPMDASYSMTVPTPADANADFTQARVVMNTTLIHDGTNSPLQPYFGSIVVAQADNTAAITPSTRQIESVTKVDALGGIDGRNVPVRQKNSLTSGVDALSLQSAGLSSQAAASQALDLVDTAQKRVLAQTQYYATQSKAFSVSNNFEGKLVDALNAGIGRLADADMSKEAAKLTAAQTQQRLAVQTLAISNSFPKLILSLFSVH